MRNRNNASINTVRGSLHFTDAEMRRLISMTMERITNLQDTRGLGSTEIAIRDKIVAGRKAQPGAF